MSPATFENDAFLSGNFSVIGTSVDRNGKWFVALFESQRNAATDTQLSWFASVNVGSSVRVSKGIPPPGWYGLGVLAKVKNARTARTHA